MKCPKCNTDKHLATVSDALIINQGPEGPLHEIMCTKCNWKMKNTTVPNTIRKEVAICSRIKKSWTTISNPSMLS